VVVPSSNTFGVISNSTIQSSWPTIVTLGSKISLEFAIKIIFHIFDGLFSIPKVIPTLDV
jgi:hypothetical protein